MAGQMITLPIRLGVRAASLLLRGTEEVATRTIGFAMRATGVARSRGDAADQPAAHKPRPGPPPARAEPGAEPAHAVAGEEPAHVSEESVLTAEYAEPGAEDGAGAEVHVKEPWPGYRELNAEDVIALLTDADPAELAAVQLFESVNQKRQMVLSAVERQLELTNNRGAAN
jgi:hypothetical protein